MKRRDDSADYDVDSLFYEPLILPHGRPSDLIDGLIAQIKSDCKYLADIRKTGHEAETDRAFFEGRIASYRKSVQVLTERWMECVK